MLQSSDRRLIGSTTSSSAMQISQPPPGITAMNETDSNADTCCLGNNFVILHYTTKQVDVYAYDKDIRPLRNVPVVTGPTAWDNPISEKNLYFDPQ